MNRPARSFFGPELATPWRAIAGFVLLVAILTGAGLTVRRRHLLAEGVRGADAASVLPAPHAVPVGASWRDSRGDGFPDSARLASAQDRENFTRWFTFLAETQYYAPNPRTRLEVEDCAALVRFAFRNSLVAHTPAWRAAAGLPYDPGFGDITKYNYPYGPLGRALFRIEGATDGPVRLNPSQFGEFADSATLLRYNTYLISRDVRAAQPGDLLFFHQAVQHEPFHSMLFVGKSYYQPQASDWIVYHTGDLDGHRGQIREVRAAMLLEHPDLRWRPLLSNPHFLGIYRLEILR